MKDLKQKEKMRNSILKGMILIVLAITLVGADIEVGYDDDTQPRVDMNIPEAPTGLSNVSYSFVNSSDFWDNLDTPADIPAQGLIQNYSITDRRTATLIVAASDSLNKEGADYICDGTADEAEINVALNALPSGGGKVFLLEGEYNLSDSISIPKDKVILEGSGKSTKVLGIIQTDLLVIDSKEDIVIKNILFYGQYPSFPLGYLNNDGIQINGERIFITNNWFENLTGSGINIGGVERSSFSDNSFKTIFISAYSIVSASYSVFNNNIIEDVSFAFDFSFGEKNIINGNSILNSFIAISVTTNGTIIYGNNIRNSTQHGIRLNDEHTNNNLILSNFIEFSDKEDTDTYNGINVKGSNNMISGNRIKDSGLYEIYIDSSALNTMIMNNNLQGNKHTATIQDDGISTTIVGNFPGGASMEIQSAMGQEIKLQPEGNLTVIFNSTFTQFDTPLSNGTDWFTLEDLNKTSSTTELVNATIDSCIWDANSASRICFDNGVIKHYA